MKHWKAIVGAVVIAALMNVSFADAQRMGVPKGWVASGAIGDGYEVGLDPAEGIGGRPAMFIRKTGWETSRAISGVASNSNAGPRTDAKIAAVSQTIDATPWRGKRVFFSLWARSAGEGEGEFWARKSKAGGVVSLTSGAPFDKIKDWQEIKVGFNVNADEVKVDFGIVLAGSGQVWVRDLKLEEDLSEPTLHEPLPYKVPIGAPTAVPVNLDLLE